MRPVDHLPVERQGPGLRIRREHGDHRFGMGDLGLDYPPHTIAFNIWSGPNAAQAPKGVSGLRWFHIAVPDQATLDAVKARLTSIGAGYTDTNEGIETKDPAGNLVKVVIG